MFERSACRAAFELSVAETPGILFAGGVWGEAVDEAVDVGVVGGTCAGVWIVAVVAAEFPLIECHHQIPPITTIATTIQIMSFAFVDIDVLFASTF